MNITPLAARMLLACTLVMATNSGMTAAQSNASTADRSIVTPEELAKEEAFNAGLEKLIAQDRAEFAATVAKIRAVDINELFAVHSVLSAPGIARARSSLANLSALSSESVAIQVSAAQRFEQYLAVTPVSTGMRNYVQASYGQTRIAQQRNSERNLVMQQALYAAIGKRLDFAEAQLGKISLGGEGQLVFADAQLEADFRQIQATVARAQEALRAGSKARVTN